MFRRRSVPSEATAAAPSLASSKRQRDALRARSGSTRLAEIVAVIPCARCGGPTASTLLLGIVETGIRENSGRVADIELLATTCDNCKQAI